MWLYVLLGVVAGIVLIFLILAIIAPKQATVERSVVVDVPQDQTFEYLRSLKRSNDWSPWMDRDLAMQTGLRGTDCEIGAVHWWRGNKEVGEGELEIVKLEPNSLIGMELRFVKPFRATNEAWLKLAPAGEGTKVSWGFHARFSPPMNVMMMFMNLDKAIGKDYEDGLQRMKKLIEAKKA